MKSSTSIRLFKAKEYRCPPSGKGTCDRARWDGRREGGRELPGFRAWSLLSVPTSGRGHNSGLCSLGRSSPMLAAKQTVRCSFHSLESANAAGVSEPPNQVPEGPKVSEAGNRAAEAKFSRHFKDVFTIGNVGVRSLLRQPTSHST